MDTFRKWLNKPKADDKSLLARFYHADHALTAVASELDSFDGRAEPERCSRLVGRLRLGQEHVLLITQKIMDELLGEDRAPRSFRAKFPEEVLQESLAGQLWFGAECLAAGSSILNREIESTEMRPLAKAVTKSLDNVRNLLRDQCLRNNTPNSPRLNLNVHDTATEQLSESLKIFDRLFAEFELRYVSAMVNVKSKKEYEMQELICVLFSETLQRALKMGLIEQEQVDSFDPALMFSIPRLAIITGLVVYDEAGPLNMGQPSDKLSEMFRPFRVLLIKIRDLLRTLTKGELHQLERLLCTNEEVHLKCDSSFDCDGGGEEGEEENNDDHIRHFSSSWKEDCDGNNNNSNSKGVQSQGTSYTEAGALDQMTIDQFVNSLGVNDEEEDNETTSVAVEGQENPDIDVINDCSSGYLIPNTNLGYLLQPSEAAALTDSFISSSSTHSVVSDEEEDDDEDEDDSTSTTTTSSSSMDSIATSISSSISSPMVNNPEEEIITQKTPAEPDSGINTENTSSDRTPDLESKGAIVNEMTSSPVKEKKREEEIEEEEEIVGNFSKEYANNWKSIHKELKAEPEAVTEPSCSGTTSRGKRRVRSSNVASSGNNRQTVKYGSRSNRGTASDKNYLRRCVACPTDTTIAGGNESNRRRHHQAPQPGSDSSSESSKQDPNVPNEIVNAIRTAVRMKFKSKEILLHRLFVCIAGVADQLQTNFASDLRKILRSVFLINVSPQPELDTNMTIKLCDSKSSAGEADEQTTGNGGVGGGGDDLLFEFRPTERDIIAARNCENESSSPNAGSNQSINSAEEVNAEDHVFSEAREREMRSSSEEAIRSAQAAEVVQSRNQNNVTRSQSLGDTSSLSGSERSMEEIYKRTRTTSTSAVPNNRTSTRSSYVEQQVDRSSNEQPSVIHPPRWVPDEEAPRCMACSALFTAFRRRHHCRNCGKVFCGICSNVSAPIPKFGFVKAVRVCRGCYSREMGTAA